MGVANYIENRWSQRRSLDMDVEILINGSVLGASRTRDVGLAFCCRADDDSAQA